MNTRPLQPGVSMSEVIPAPHVCRTHRKLCRTFADGAIWCQDCERYLSESETVNRHRGRATAFYQPPWTPVKTD